MIGTRCALTRSAASTAQREQGTPRLAQPAAQTRAQKILRMAHALLRPTLAEAIRAIAAALSVARVGLEGRDCRACNGAHVLVVRASAAPPRLVAEVLQRVRIDPAGAQRRVKCKPSGPPYPRGPSSAERPRLSRATLRFAETCRRGQVPAQMWRVGTGDRAASGQMRRTRGLARRAAAHLSPTCVACNRQRRLRRIRASRIHPKA
jgi:hypothetical protein